MISAAQSVQSEMKTEEKDDLNIMIDHLKGWKGSMDKNSVAASVYSYTFHFLNKSLFHAYDPESEENRLLFTDNYLMVDSMVNLIESAATDGKKSHFNPICA